MRQSRKDKQEVDLLKPVGNLPDPEPGDCFGSDLYDPRDKDCSLCADLLLCGIRREATLRTKKKQFEEEHGPMLDEVDFKSVNWETIHKKALEYEDTGEPMTFQELIDAILIIAKIKDEVAVAEFIKREMPERLFNIKDGFVYGKR
jgi:hypothetical protein